MMANRLTAAKRVETSAASLENELLNMAHEELISMLERFYAQGLHDLVREVAGAAGLSVGTDGKIRKREA